MNKQRHKQRHQMYSTLYPIHDLIQQTLAELRQAPAVGSNPLAGALETYRQRLHSLPQGQLRMVRNELLNHIMQEDDLSTRFVLKLMHDIITAVCEGRRPAYLMMPLGC